MKKLLDKLPRESLSSFPFFSPFLSPFASISVLYLTSILSLSSWTCTFLPSVFPVVWWGKKEDYGASNCPDSVGFNFKTDSVRYLTVGQILPLPGQGALFSLTKLPWPMIMGFSVKLGSNSMLPFPCYIDIRLIDDLHIIKAMDALLLFQLITIILLPPHLRNLMNTLNCLGKEIRS